MLPDVRDYKGLRAAFRWRMPERYNIGVDACDQRAAREPDRVAILVRQAAGGFERITYGRLCEQSNRLANALAAEIQDFVKTRLSAHEYPREVSFIDQMPMTTTGKVIRRMLCERA